MKIHGLKLEEGADIGNLTCPRGSEFPKLPSDGELFRLKGHAKLTNGLYSFEDGYWQLLAKVQPMVEVGCSTEIDVNTNTPVSIPWTNTYLISTDTFEVVGTKIKVKKAGNYEVYYSISIENRASLFSNKTVGVFVRLVSGYIFNRSRSYQFTSDSGFSSIFQSGSVKFTTPLYVNDTLELCGQRLGGSGSSYTISDNCIFGIRKVE